MRLGLLLIVAAVPFIELALLIKLGQTIGFWWTLLTIAFTAALGTYVINRQSLSVMQKAMDAVQSGRAPVASAVEGVILIIAGLLLITPGLFTDVIGLVLLIPIARRWIAIKGLRRLLKSHVIRFVIFGEEIRTASPGDRRWDKANPEWRGDADSGQNQSGEPGRIIEGEYERVSERTVDPARRREK